MSDGLTEGAGWFSFDETVAAALNLCDRLESAADYAPGEDAKALKTRLNAVGALMPRALSVLLAVRQRSDTVAPGQADRAPLLASIEQDRQQVAEMTDFGEAETDITLGQRLDLVLNRVSRMRDDLTSLEGYVAEAEAHKRRAEGHR